MAKYRKWHQLKNRLASAESYRIFVAAKWQLHREIGLLGRLWQWLENNRGGGGNIFSIGESVMAVIIGRKYQCRDKRENNEAVMKILMQLKIRREMASISAENGMKYFVSYRESGEAAAKRKSAARRNEEKNEASAENNMAISIET